MTLGPRLFVLFVFSILALSFLATTLVLAWEFWAYGRWIDFLAIDSHLFVFFPTFGLISLVAFYLPTCALVHLYWHHVRLGPQRFINGLLIASLASWGIAAFILGSPNKPIWQISPDLLETDSGYPAGCVGARSACERLPVLSAVANLRAVSQSRGSLKALVRTCKPDPLIEKSVQVGPKRLCIASTLLHGPGPRFTSDAVCCKAQESLVNTIHRMQAKEVNEGSDLWVQKIYAPLKIVEWRPESDRSLTGVVHAALLPLKVFLLLILLVISLFLTIRFSQINEHYGALLPKIRVGVLVGTFAALFFPLMSQAFLFANEALLGDYGTGNYSNTIAPLISFVFGLWAVVMVLFFYRGGSKEIEVVGRVCGAAAGGLALMKYEAIVGFLVLALGSGARWYVLVSLAMAAFVIAIGTMIRTAQTPRQPVRHSESRVTRESQSSELLVPESPAGAA